MFLSILERRETKERGTENYINTLIKGDYNKPKDKKTKEDIGGLGRETIKERDPIDNHRNDADYVGIILKDKIFGDRMWIRETYKNKNKIGKNIKQYSYGQVCSTYQKKDLVNIIIYLWDQIDKDSDFFKENNDIYNKVINNLKPMKQIKQNCNFIKKLLGYHQDKKTGKKTWLKLL